MPFLLPDPRTDNPHLHFVMLRILRHPPPLSSVFTCDQLAVPSPDRPAPTAVQFYVRPRGGVQTWDEGQAARLRAMLVASVQRRHPKGLKVHVHSVDRFGCLAALTRVLKAANLSVTRAKVRARKEFGVGVRQSRSALPPQLPSCSALMTTSVLSQLRLSCYDAVQYLSGRVLHRPPIVQLPSSANISIPL